MAALPQGAPFGMRGKVSGSNGAPFAAIARQSQRAPHAMTPIPTDVRSAAAACSRLRKADERWLHAPDRSGGRAALVLAAAACIVAQHAAMPPRQPCPAGLALATVQIGAS